MGEKYITNIIVYKYRCSKGRPVEVLSTVSQNDVGDWDFLKTLSRKHIMSIKTEIL